MVLCDMGNTNAHINDNGRVFSIESNKSIKYLKDKKFYFISVNDLYAYKLKDLEGSVDLEPYFSIDTEYRGLGIDRVAACYAINDGIVIDAGSAITIDVMSNGIHLGGFIMPGLAFYKQSFDNISIRLEHNFNFGVNVEELPQNTKDAISYGTIKPILMAIEDASKGKNIFFTGGDGQYFSRFFEGSVYDQSLVFRGMKKLIENRGLNA